MLAFMRQGLERHEQVLCILDTLNAETVLALLGKGDSEAALPYLVSGQLRFMGSEQFYTAQGAFKVETTLDAICAQQKRAREHGYQGMRIVSEMSWTLRYTTDMAHLLEYESRLNERLPYSGCIMLCLYDARHFGAQTLETMLRAHPTSTHGEYLRENRAYVVYAGQPAWKPASAEKQVSP